uniref:DUF8039 domain-containing protein n=1 Tax=Oryza punctata TaxID=4537 RepID=A0A0E0LZJ9_ORYPU
MTPCELHTPARNITIMVVTAGYAKVAVDRVVKEFRQLTVDIPGGEGETTLSEVEHGFILWRERYIVIPGAPPRLPSPPRAIISPLRSPDRESAPRQITDTVSAFTVSATTVSASTSSKEESQQSNSHTTEATIRDDYIGKHRSGKGRGEDVFL